MKNYAKKHETIQFTLYKFEPNSKAYDFTNIYQELKVIALPEEIKENDIDKNTMLNWMSNKHLNEVFATKIPIYHSKEFNDD